MVWESFVRRRCEGVMFSAHFMDWYLFCASGRGRATGGPRAAGRSLRAGLYTEANFQLPAGAVPASVRAEPSRCSDAPCADAASSIKAVGRTSRSSETRGRTTKKNLYPLPVQDSNGPSRTCATEGGCMNRE
ncbi:hypothetical protein EVAR_26759_1 [Eumeta japonica]|uniref:Uncharacterized protein n=1 Tax=Eumeta variegata TaxID=151549 RepID=A0A4C1XAK7_EUMVA|nr:hypothetical protein EVAR_26759_1 [Eumeta japonica]